MKDFAHNQENNLISLMLHLKEAEWNTTALLTLFTKITLMIESKHFNHAFKSHLTDPVILYWFCFVDYLHTYNYFGRFLLPI